MSYKFISATVCLVSTFHGIYISLMLTRQLGSNFLAQTREADSLVDVFGGTCTGHLHLCGPLLTYTLVLHLQIGIHVLRKLSKAA